MKMGNERRRGPGEGSIYKVRRRGWAAALPVMGASHSRGRAH